MEFTDKDGLNARNLFHKHFMVLLGLLSKPFEFYKHNQLTEILEILSKLLIIIERTHVKPPVELFDDKVLSGLLNFVSVRKIPRDFEIKTLISKYETTFNSIKNFANIFYSKDLTFHKTMSILTQYIDGYNNILSRSVLMFNISFLMSKAESDLQAFFIPFLRNEVCLYIPSTLKPTITPTVMEKALNHSYTIFFDGLTKLCFDKEKQYINIQKVLRELNLLIKLMVM